MNINSCLPSTKHNRKSLEIKVKSAGFRNYLSLNLKFRN